jgi:pyridoxine 5'-phosphate synthase PdxJ
MTEPPRPEELQWAMDEATAQAVPVAPGWFRAWPTADEKWSVVNLKGATQLIVNHSREDDRHPNAWTVRALFGDKVVEMHGGPYNSKAEAVLVAQAMLSLAFGQH